MFTCPLYLPQIVANHRERQLLDITMGALGRNIAPTVLRTVCRGAAGVVVSTQAAIVIAVWGRFLCGRFLRCAGGSVLLRGYSRELEHSSEKG